MFEFYRTRPILAWSLTLIGGLFFLWVLWPKNSGGGTVVTSQASTTPVSEALQIAQIQAQADNNAAQAQLQLRQAELSVQAMLGELGYQLEDRNAERVYALQSAGITSAENVNLAQLQANQQNFAIQAAAQDAADQRAANLQAYFIAVNADTQRAILDTSVITNLVGRGATRGTLESLMQLQNQNAATRPTYPGG